MNLILRWIRNGRLKGVIIMMTFMRKKEKGFTLIEVMLVVIIIGIIAIIALPKLLVTKITAETRSCLSNQQSVRTALEQYQWGEGVYPTLGTAPGGADCVEDLVADGYTRSATDDSSGSTEQISAFCPSGPEYVYDGAGSFTCSYDGDDSGTDPDHVAL